MLAKIPQPYQETADMVILDGDCEELDSNLLKYRTGVEMIDMKNSILDAIFKINTYFNAYRFLKNAGLPFYQQKANKKAAEIFQTIRALLGRIKKISVLTGDGYLTGEQVFQNICDKRNSQHMQALALIQGAKDKEYPFFKTFLEEACSNGLQWS